MLVKLALGVDFTSMLTHRFYADPKSVKRQSSHQCFFVLVGSARTKDARKTLVKLNLASSFCMRRSQKCEKTLSPSVNFINVLFTHFLYKILAPKITKPNVIREKLLNLFSTKKMCVKC